MAKAESREPNSSSIVDYLVKQLTLGNVTEHYDSEESTKPDSYSLNLSLRDVYILPLNLLQEQLLLSLQKRARSMLQDDMADNAKNIQELAKQIQEISEKIEKAKDPKFQESFYNEFSKIYNLLYEAGYKFSPDQSVYGEVYTLIIPSVKYQETKVAEPGPNTTKATDTETIAALDKAVVECHKINREVDALRKFIVEHVITEFKSKTWKSDGILPIYHSTLNKLIGKNVGSAHIEKLQEQFLANGYQIQDQKDRIVISRTIGIYQSIETAVGPQEEYYDQAYRERGSYGKKTTSDFYQERIAADTRSAVIRNDFRPMYEAHEQFFSREKGKCIEHIFTKVKEALDKNPSIREVTLKPHDIFGPTYENSITKQALNEIREAGFTIYYPRPGGADLAHPTFRISLYDDTTNTLLNILRKEFERCHGLVKNTAVQTTESYFTATLLAEEQPNVVATSK